MPSFLSTLSLISFLAYLPFALQSEGAGALDTQPAPLSEPASAVLLEGSARDAVLKNIADALEYAETARGRFGQIGADYQFTEGSFAIRRPGRVRFDYDAPSPILIIADGTTVAIEDRDLETLDRVPLGATPLGLLLDRRIDFETDAEVLGVVTTPSQVMVTLRDKNGENEGELTLILDASTYALQGWRTFDAAGATTAVELTDVETNVRLSPRLFIIEDPEDEEDD